jgi:hypothetical protein
VGVALRGRDDAGALAVGFLGEAVGGAGDEAVGAVAGGHGSEQLVAGGRREGQVGADGAEVAADGGFGRGDVEDEPGEQRGGLVVPESGLPSPGGQDEEVGEGGGVGVAGLGVGFDEIERVHGRVGGAGQAEGVEGDDAAEAAAVARGDGVVFALQIQDDDRAGMGEEVGDDGVDPLAACRWGRG